MHIETRMKESEYLKYLTARFEVNRTILRRNVDEYRRWVEEVD